MARIAPAPALGAAAQRSRHRWWREILVLTALYFLYELTRVFVAAGHVEAFANAHRVLDLEGWLQIDHEQPVNDFVSDHRVLAVAMCYSYALMHYVVTPLVLIWLWRWRPLRYPGARTALVVGTVIALLGFWLFPTAPPRMLPGFVDTMSAYSQYGWWGHDASAPQGMGGLTNEFAAMPSLHVGWAVWCGWQVLRSVTNRIAKTIAALYPVWILAVVVGTANHYVADAFAGIIVIGIGACTGRAIRVYRRRRRLAPRPA